MRKRRIVVKNLNENSSSEELSVQKKMEKRGRGRPKGSKNKKKTETEAHSELSLREIFSTLVNSKSREDINKKFNKFKNTSLSCKGSKKEAEEKRGRGRPKGVKNRPKIHNE